MNSRIYLSPPHMSEQDFQLISDAFRSNWIAPLGPHVEAFETEFAEKLGIKHAVALSSGTAALHLALLAVGVQPGDEVITASLTFVATANAIRYCGAKPVFLDSETSSWNLDPNLLEQQLRTAADVGQLPAAVLAVDVFGQCADYAAIGRICKEYGVPLVEDAAESLGATYQGKPAGTHADIACFSFNGNKIITTSGGGMLATEDSAWAERVRFLATQARLPGSYYEHEDVGFNYRLSNLLAAVGRGQLQTLDEKVEQRRANFREYEEELGSLPGVTMMPEPADCRSTRWLTCVLIDHQQFGCNPEEVRLALEAENIEARRIWKPMHMQPVNADCRKVGGTVSKAIFHNGLCLPSGSSLTAEEQQRVVDTFKACPSRESREAA